MTSIRNGIKLEKGVNFTQREGPRREISLGEDTCITSAVARPTPVKSFDNLLHTAKLLIGEGLNAKVLLIGDGPLSGATERLAAELEIREKCCAIGSQRHYRELVRSGTDPSSR